MEFTTKLRRAGAKASEDFPSVNKNLSQHTKEICIIFMMPFVELRELFALSSAIPICASPVCP
jgi:hypothetical protein